MIDLFVSCEGNDDAAKNAYCNDRCIKHGEAFKWGECGGLVWKTCHCYTSSKE